MKKIAILEMFYGSKLYGSQPNLVIETTATAKGKFYAVGVYNYNSVTGRSFINPLQGCEKMSEKELIIKCNE